MRIEAHNHLGEPINTKITRIVIYDNYDNPIGLAIEHQHNWVYIGHARDPEFREYLKAIGIEKTCIVDVLDLKKLKPLDK